MKNASRIGLLSLALLLGASAPIDAAQQNKKQSFFQKHKRKLIAGAAAAATIGIAVALGLHTDKTMSAIEKAGIRPSDSKFNTAVKVVGLLGPLGPDRALDMIVRATTMIDPVTEAPILSPAEAAVLVHSKVGDALAYYFGLKPWAFKLKATQKGLAEGKAVFGSALDAAGDKIAAGWKKITSSK